MLADAASQAATVACGVRSPCQRRRCEARPRSSRRRPARRPLPSRRPAPAARPPHRRAPSGSVGAWSGLRLDAQQVVGRVELVALGDRLAQRAAPSARWRRPGCSAHAPGRRPACPARPASPAGGRTAPASAAAPARCAPAPARHRGRNRAGPAAPARGMRSTSTSVTARTDACRSVPCSAAISPWMAPGPTRASGCSVAPARLVTSSSPLTTTNIASPGSPSRSSSSPGARRLALDGRRQALQVGIGQAGEEGCRAERVDASSVQSAYRPARYWCTNWTAMEPSPTALAMRLTDRCRTSPAHEHAGHARLEQERLSGQAPSRQVLPLPSRLLLQVPAGDHEPAAVAQDGALQPLGARLLADEDEERSQVQLLGAVRPGERDAG